MTPSENCLDLIRTHEGCRLAAYRCPAGVLTIGYGHTQGVKAGMSITAAEAEGLLRSDAAVASSALLPLDLNQNQFDALTSFVFNLGAGTFRKSTLHALVAEGRYAEAAKQFPRWVFADGKRLPGLAVRRDDERALFESP